MENADLAIGIITVSSTAFTILFGVVTLFPTFVSFIENTNMARRVRLLQKREYRFLKRLIEGRSVDVLLSTAMLFIISNIGSVIYLWINDIFILKVSLTICLFTLAVLIVLLIITFIQSMEPSEDEYELITDFVPSDEK